MPKMHTKLQYSRCADFGSLLSYAKFFQRRHFATARNPESLAGDDPYRSRSLERGCGLVANHGEEPFDTSWECDRRIQFDVWSLSPLITTISLALSLRASCPLE